MRGIFLSVAMGLSADPTEVFINSERENLELREELTGDLP